MSIPEINIEDFSYDLPPDRIAQHPLPERDSSRLLCSIDGAIKEDRFRNLAGYIPEGSMMVFNDTRVIRARMIFQKPTGTQIEILCLEPVGPTCEINHAFQQHGPVVWRCLIGNAKRWKHGILEKRIEISGSGVTLQIDKKSELDQGTFLVVFSWDQPEMTFGELLEGSGRIPLPPYISREDDATDILRYQTIYALQDGSVAAPTAGLHFTAEVMNSLRTRNILREQVTLHVGLGTFKPVSVSHLSEHVMHEEQIIVTARTIRHLINHLPKPVIAVGTTSVRTLESLYWMGVSLIRNPGSALKETGQWDPYNQTDKHEIQVSEALQALLNLMQQQGVAELTTSTRLLIVPGYRFRIIHGMITNFHQPGSTLLMLIAAFLGEKWKEVYQHALANGFRFLSYGDSCLFLR